MKRRLVYLLLPWMLHMGCQSDKLDNFSSKIRCYEETLATLQNDPEYLDAYCQFLDSFPALKKREDILQYREYRLDSAIFFNKRKDECVLLILQKDVDEVFEIFGYGRCIRGVKTGSSWNFNLSMEFIYGAMAYKRYKNNEFKNISNLARYSVLNAGKVRSRGCEIDSYYWFEYLKQ